MEIIRLGDAISQYLENKSNKLEVDGQQIPVDDNGVRACLALCLEKAFPWFESVEVTEQPTVVVVGGEEQQMQRVIDVVVQHTYPEGLEMEWYFRPVVESHAPRHLINLRCERVEVTQ